MKKAPVSYLRRGQESRNFRADAARRAAYNSDSATEAVMARDEDDLDDSEYPEPDDDSEDDGTVPCPYCGAALYEDAERCPRCENYVSREDAPSRVPLWVKVTALVCLVVAVLWAVYGF
jgi:hypothetical protein